MAAIAKQMFDGIARGVQRAATELSAEVKRLGVQGQMEAASALFNGNAFVAYGPGQYTPPPEHGQDHEQQQQNELSRER